MAAVATAVVRAILAPLRAPSLVTARNRRPPPSLLQTDSGPRTQRHRLAADDPQSPCLVVRESVGAVERVRGDRDLRPELEPAPNRGGQHVAADAEAVVARQQAEVGELDEAAAL